MLFFSVGLFQWSVADIAIVIAVLLVHESGHYVVMRKFGYRDTRCGGSGQLENKHDRGATQRRGRGAGYRVPF